MPKTKSSQKARIKELEHTIAHLDTLYEGGRDCLHPDTGIITTDGEYDAFRRELQKLHPKSSIFNSATASNLKTASKKIKHDPPLTSIEKASHEDVSRQEEMLFKWITDKVKDGSEEVQNLKTVAVAGKTYKDAPFEYPEGHFYAAYKLDGVALALYYQKGKLTSAGLRPRDGINGEDVTQQATYVSGIPTQLGAEISCSIRGELICKEKDFEKVQSDLSAAGDKLRANPRNHTAGGIRQFKNPEKTKKMRLSFIAYSIEGLSNPPYHTEMERSTWCQETLKVPYIKTKTFKFKDLARMEADLEKLDYEVDGVIIGVNDLEEQEQLGRHGDPITGNPKGKIAWKFREEEATPCVEHIEWNTGRTGKIVPVANFEAVRLAGTNVTRATLHNAGFLKRNQITVGSKIAIRKAGKIIPKVVGVISGQGEPVLPEVCPSCENPTRLVTGGTAKSGEEMLELVCESETCSSQNVSGLCHYLATFGVLGLGEARVRQLVEGGAVSIPADFYRLTVDSAQASGLTLRQALLAVGSIHMIASPEQLDDTELASQIDAAVASKKSIPFSKLFATFGIEAAGKSAGKALADHFGTLEKLQKASKEELEEVEDIGAKTAETIHAYLKEHAEEISDLLKFVEPEAPKTGNLSGTTFCFSGGFEDGKRFWEDKVTALGAKCVGSVSKKTNYLVAGPGSGSKSEKAKKLNVPILDVAGLKKLLG